MGWGGWGGQWAKVALQDTMGPAVVPKELSMASKPHYKPKQANR